MLIKYTNKDPRVIIKIGMVFILFFFLMNFLPRFTPIKESDLYDGVHGALLGISIGLLGWGTYLNGKRRRAP